jgi:hypothetical protein
MRTRLDEETDAWLQLFMSIDPLLMMSAVGL